MNLTTQPEIIDSLKQILSLSGKTIIPSTKYPHYTAFTSEEGLEQLANLHSPEHINLPLALYSAYNQGIKPVIIFSDHQQHSWTNHLDSYSEVYAVSCNLIKKNFIIQDIYPPPWWISGDTAVFLVSTNQPSSLQIVTSVDTGKFWVEKSAFLPVNLPVTDNLFEVNFYSPQDSINLLLEPNQNISMYVNDDDIRKILSYLMPDSSVIFEDSLTDLSYVIVNEQNLLPIMENLGSVKNIVVFLNNGQILKPWLELNYPIKIQSQSSELQSVYFGNSLLSGIQASRHLKVSFTGDIDIEKQVFFENGDPAVIITGNLILFTFVPRYSDILWNPGAFIFILTQWFNHLPPPEPTPFMDPYERSNLYLDDLNDFNVPWLTFHQTEELIRQHLYFNNNAFLIIFLLGLLLLEGLYSHSINF